jgi:DNA-binding transcriptional LysR family regulator
MTGLERKHVVSVRLVPVCAPSHPLARAQRSIGAAALSKAVQIVLSERRREGGAKTKDHGVLSTKTWRVLDLPTKHALIAGGLGWGHMPEHVVRDDLDHGRLVELRLDAWGPGSLTRSLEIVRRRGAVFGPVARWAETHLADLCREAVDGAREPTKRRQTT